MKLTAAAIRLIQDSCRAVRTSARLRGQGPSAVRARALNYAAVVIAEDRAEIGRLELEGEALEELAMVLLEKVIHNEVEHSDLALGQELLAAETLAARTARHAAIARGEVSDIISDMYWVWRNPNRASAAAGRRVFSNVLKTPREPFEALAGAQALFADNIGHDIAFNSSLQGSVARRQGYFA